MINLQEFRQLVEEEKSDYSKFDMLVRAGLANKAQLARIHRILDKMTEERPQFNNADREIMRNLFNRMIDIISNNKQIFQKTRQAVREEDEKQVESIQLDEALDLNNDPPFVLVLKRKSIRLYPNNTKIALYYNQKLDKYFSIPYGGGVDAPVQAEETIKKAVDAIGQLQKIKDSHSHGTVNHKDGSASKVDVQTAHAVLTVHKSLNDDNKKKFADMVARSSHHMQKAANFAVSKMK
jgi:hypothetical protein